MVECEYCDRRHREEVQVEACRARVERREAREAKKAEDTERRRLRAEAQSPAAFIREGLKMGKNWSNIVAQLRREYPPPDDGEWTLVAAVRLDSERLNWPEPGERILWPRERVTIGALRKALREGEA